jgi:HD-like signal output (HDOD) protein
MLTPLTAPETLDRARKALQSGRGAGLPELLRLIETLSTHISEATISEIADLVEQDAAVLSRILTVANTIMHNPNMAPLTSIHQAVHQLGFHRVRSLAVSMMLVHNTGGANPPEQRAAAAQALCAGLLAQGCARTLGSIDPEMAFACAALRHFGAIILPAVSLELCQEMRRLKKTKTEDQACRDCFGLTPLELSRRLLGASRLPEEVLHALRECQPESMGGMSASTYGARLLGVADFGGRLASLALDGNSPAELFSERSRDLGCQFARLLPGVEAAIEAALVHTDDRLDSFTRGHVSGAFSSPALARIKSRVRGQSPAGSVPIAAPTESAPDPVAPVTQDVPPDAGGAPAGADAAPEPVPEGAPPALGPEAPFWTEQLAQSRAFETQAVPVAPPAHPWVATLTFVRDSFGADLAWMFAAQPAGHQFALAHSAGPAWPELGTRTIVRPEERTVFGVCLTRRENVVIHNRTERSLAAYLPPWFREHPDSPGAFILIPLLTGDKVTGLVLIGWSQAQRITVSAAQTEIARQLFANTRAAA